MAKYIKLGKISGVLNIGPAQADNVHGRYNKDIAVLHETVSPNYPGWGDIISVSDYLDNKDYGIHSVIDDEGHIAWAYGHGEAIFYHTDSSGTKGNGKINSRGIGIELVSRVMMNYSDNTSRWRVWWTMDKEINACAKLLAWASRAHNFPLVDSPGNKPGVTTHWEVTQMYGVTGGHWDCYPRHRGGYFPKLRIIERAKFYKKLGY